MSEQHREPGPVLDDVAFTYDWYRRFLDHLDGAGVRFRAYTDALQVDDVLLRHDVDLSPARAVRVARIEAELGVHATYFVLLSSPLYNVHTRHTRTAIREIESLGHDVGLHFSTHQYWPQGGAPDRTADRDAPDRMADRDVDERAVERAVQRERQALGTVANPIDTVSFHAPPEWVQGREFEAFDSTYAPAFFTEIAYRADSNQRWRDRPPLADGRPDQMQVLTHPGLWGHRDRTFEQRVREAAATTCERTDTYARGRYLDPDSGGTT